MAGLFVLPLIMTLLGKCQEKPEICYVAEN